MNLITMDLVLEVKDNNSSYQAEQNYFKISDFDIAQQLKWVKHDGWAIKYIDNPSLEVQLAAIKQNISVLDYLPYKRFIISNYPELLL